MNKTEWNDSGTNAVDFKPVWTGGEAMEVKPQPEETIKENPNLAIWDAVKNTDPQWIKNFDRGNFKGTAVAPLYNFRRATETFGPYGLGWGVAIEEETMREDPVSGELVHCMKVSVWYKWPHAPWLGEIGHAMGCGATKFAYTTAKGKRLVDEDVEKKTLTDAMTNALAKMGFSADVYIGLFDDNKYVNQMKEKFDPKKAKGAEMPEGLPNSKDIAYERYIEWAGDKGDVVLGMHLFAATLGLEIKGDKLTDSNWRKVSAAIHLHSTVEKKSYKEYVDSLKAAGG